MGHHSELETTPAKLCVNKGSFSTALGFFCICFLGRSDGILTCVHIGSRQTICGPVHKESVGYRRVFIKSLRYAYASGNNTSPECTLKKHPICSIDIGGVNNNSLDDDPIFRTCSGNLSCTIDVSSVNITLHRCLGQTRTPSLVAVDHECIKETNILRLNEPFGSRSYSSRSLYLGVFPATRRIELRSTCKINGHGLQLTAVDLYAPGYNPNCDKDNYYVAVWFKTGGEGDGRQTYQFHQKEKPHYANEVVLGQGNIASIELIYDIKCKIVNVWWKIESDLSFNVSCHLAEENHRQGVTDRLMPNVTTSTPLETRFPVATVAGGASGVVLVAVLIVCLVICFRKRASGKKLSPDQRPEVIEHQYENVQDTTDTAHARCPVVYSEPAATPTGKVEHNFGPSHERGSGSDTMKNLQHSVTHPGVSESYGSSEYYTIESKQMDPFRVNTFNYKTGMNKTQNFQEKVSDSSELNPYYSIDKHANVEQRSISKGANLYDRSGVTANDYDKVELQTTDKATKSYFDEDIQYNKLYWTKKDTKERGGYELATFVPDESESSKLHISNY